MNVIQLYKYIGAISEQIPLVHSYSNKSVYDYWNMDEVKYGSVCFSVQNVSAGSHTTTYTGILYYGDRLMEDRSNIESVYSDATLSLQTIINTLSNSDDVEVSFPIQITYFEQEFADQLAGAYANLTITVEGVGQCGFDGTILPTPIYPGEDGFDTENYYTKSQVDALLDRYDAIVDEKLDEYAKETDLASYVTKTELDERGYIDHIPANYVTESELNETLDRKGYLTSIPSGYVTESELDEKLDREGYLTEIPANYVTESELESKNYLTEVPDIYVTKQEVANEGYLKEIPSYYVTESELESKNYLTEVPDIYVTKQEVADAGYLTEIPPYYVTESELESKRYLTEVPDIYITKQEVADEGYLKEIPSYYVTETELEEKGYLTEIPPYYVTESEIAEQNFATKDYVIQAIAGEQDILENYYTKEEADSQFATPDEVKDIIQQTANLENYYTKEEVDTKIANVEVDLTGYATEAYVNNLVGKINEVLDSVLNDVDTESLENSLNSILNEI